MQIEGLLSVRGTTRQLIFPYFTKELIRERFNTITHTPDFQYTYVTQWTDNEYRGIRVRSNRLIRADPIMNAEISRQTYGLTFNWDGTRVLATGYYYAHNEIDVYRPVGKGLGEMEGDLEYLGSITLYDVDGLDICADGDGGGYPLHHLGR